MAIEDITAETVRAALAEHDRLGSAAFCHRYGFRGERDYVIVSASGRYATRAVLAAAHGHLPGMSPLEPDEVPGDEVINDSLERLGLQVNELRPPHWAEDELILACSLLFQNGRKALKVNDPRVRELSALLQCLPAHAAEDRGHNFRSPSSVQRKLYDLQTWLPEYDKKRTRGGQLDRVVLQRFHDNPSAMEAEAAAIRARYGEQPVTAWALFSTPGDPRYLDNGGYQDVLGVRYVYDNEVFNSRGVTVGDIIALCDGEQVNGVAHVQAIDAQDGVLKVQRVCPVCDSARFDEREAQRPLLLVPQPEMPR